jgi:PAS domain S-box-containing protein
VSGAVVTVAHTGLIAAVEQAADGIVITDALGAIQYVNPAFTALTGYPAEEVLGKNPRLLKSGRHSPAFYAELWSTLLSGRVWHGEVTNRRKDGALYDEEMRIAPVCDEQGVTTGYIAIKRDVTGRRARESAQAFLAAIVEHSEDAIVATTPAGTILTWNHGAEAIFGITAPQAIGQNVSLFIPPDRMSRMARFIDRVSHGEVLSNYEGICRRADGRRIHVSVTGFPISDPSGKVTATVALLRDSTERDLSEQKLQESEERFRTMADGTPSIMWVTGVTGEIEFVNRACREFFGITSEEVHGRRWQTVVRPDDQAAYVAAFERSVREHLPFEAEAHGRRADGEWRFMGSRAQPRFSPAGEFMGHIGLCADITERRRAAQALLESEERFRAVFEHAPSGICVTGMDGRFIQVNMAFCRMVGYSEQELLGMPWSALTHPDDLESSLRTKGKISRNPGGWEEAEKRYIHRNGSVVWVRIRLAVVLDSDAVPLCHLVHVEDITERRRAEQALQESEERFRIMADSCPIGIWVTDPQGETQFANGTYRNFCGIASDQVDQDQWKRLIHPDDGPEFLKAFDRALKDHKPFMAVWRLRRADGEWRWIESHAASRFSPDGEFLGLVGASKDITDRRQAEQALKASEEKFRQLAENIHEVFWMVNAAGAEILYISPAYEQIWGRSCQSLNENPMDWLDAIHSGDRERVREIFAKQMQGEFVEMEYRIWTPDGQEKWIRNRSFPIRNESGQFTRIAGISEEITEQKRYESELIRAREDADAANRAKSRFLANMSHEIRTPMNGVVGMNQLLLETSLTPEQRHFVEVAQDSGRTLLTLIDDILDLSKIETGKMVLENASFNLSHIVEDVARLLSLQAHAKELRLDVRVSPKIPRLLRGDAHRLRQVLTNLAANAVKFTERGAVTLHATLESARPSGATVRFSVADTGIGISQEQIPGLFSPFVQADASTTRRYGGTGLGLTISKQLVERMGGAIGVESRPGEGSTFWFTATFEHAAAVEPEPRTGRTTVPDDSGLRRAGPDVSDPGAISIPSPQGSSGELRSRHDERILVAEDNFTNREVILAQLRKLGYIAHAVSNGAEAVDTVQHGGYDLVLMDCAMPVMDGYEATHRIRQSEHARIPIIALTASAMAPDRERCLVAGMDDYLAKPVELPRLEKTLARWTQKSRRFPISAPKSGSRPTSQSSPQPPDPAVPVFAPDSLLRRLMGDRELAATVLQAFLGDAPLQIEHLRARLAAQDAPGARLHAHSLKGAAGNVGGEALRHAAAAIETAAAAGHLAEANRGMPDLEAKLLELKHAIEEEWYADENQRSD